MRPLRIEVEEQRPLERRERQLVRPERPLERMAPQPADQLGAAADDPGLRPAEELVARERDEVGARRRCSRGASGSSASGAKLPEPRSSSSGSPWRRATAASSFSAGRSVNPTVRKFDWCTRRSSAVSAPDRRLVVGGARAVRRPHLHQPRSGALQHLVDPEAVADLDQLAARDDHLATVGERGDREQQGGGVVVDDEGVLGAGELPEDRGEMVVPRAAPPVGEVVLEVRVGACRAPDVLERRRPRAARGRGSCAGRRRWR